MLVSAATREGIDRLEELLVSPCIHRQSAECGLETADPISTAAVSNARHRQALESVKQSLAHAVQSVANEMPGDFMAIDVRGALDSLGHITGETVTEDIIHRIFMDFCVGK
jgi:tRNA modification GTPase